MAAVASAVVLTSRPNGFPLLRSEVGGDLHHHTPTFEVLELLGGGFRRRLVLYEVDVDVIFLAVRELAVDRLAFPRRSRTWL